MASSQTSRFGIHFEILRPFIRVLEGAPSPKVFAANQGHTSTVKHRPVLRELNFLTREVATSTVKHRPVLSGHVTDLTVRNLF